jgi:cysteine-rich repeat protein
LSDVWYELYIGPVTEVYCTDFESDPTVEGWTLSGDFEWGTPAAPDGGSDPVGAFSGDFALGIDLAADGNYEAESVSTAVSPEIDVTGYSDVRLQYRRWLNVEDAQYDQATIVVDGQTVWGNGATNDGETHHRDGEWRFHDVELGNLADDGKVQISFGLTADQGLEFGGWTVDQLCVVAAGAGQACGNGAMNGVEECDDGNLADGDGCSSVCDAEDGFDDGGCCSSAGDDGGAAPLLLGLGTLLVIGGRRRRRRA